MKTERILYSIENNNHFDLKFEIMGAIRNIGLVFFCLNCIVHAIFMTVILVHKDDPGSMTPVVCVSCKLSLSFVLVILIIFRAGDGNEDSQINGAIYFTFLVSLLANIVLIVLLFKIYLHGLEITPAPLIVGSIFFLVILIAESVLELAFLLIRFQDFPSMLHADCCPHGPGLDVVTVL